MLKLKSCPKCNGDLFSESDRYGEFESCLQCGNLVEEPGPGVAQVEHDGELKERKPTKHDRYELSDEEVGWKKGIYDKGWLRHN